ncbi:MAG: tetratricopeptide repeat protein [Bdellovibrionales bacterium]
MSATALQQAMEAHQQGDIGRAVLLYETILADNPKDIDALNLLGSLRHTQGRSEEGLNMIRQALVLDANNPPAWFNMGMIFFDHRQYKEAAAAFMEAAKRAPTRVDFWLALGRAYTEGGENNAALATFENLVTLAPQLPAAWLELAQAEERAGLFEEARTNAEKALELALAQADADARRQAFALIAAVDKHLLQPQRQWDWAVRHTTIAPDDPAAWTALGRIALAHSRNMEAEGYFAKAQQLDPAQLDARWFRTFALVLPIYESTAQIKEHMTRYTQAVRDLHAFVKTLPDGALQGVEDLFNMAYPLFLAYTGENITEAQRVTGELFSDVLARRFGAHRLLTVPERDARNTDGKTRLAFVSETFFYHSNMKLRRSWLKRLDRSRYHITCYHVGTRIDAYTKQIADMVDELHHYPDDFNGVLARLRADQPDIIQYTNVGLKPLTIKLAALRLAPVQCTTWGHPVTSGLPTMDYYLSSELMEPEGAAAHYTETLVSLPGLSVVPQPIFNVSDRIYQDMARADFGLTDTDVFYLCLQSVQKYLPEFDNVHAAIAEKVPNSKFVFINHAENAAVADVFRHRMEQPFRDHGLDPDKHLIFLPFQEQDGYRALHMLADITLDSLGWSGANTTFEALELGGLVVTQAGRFMRGRHTSGCLQLMGVPELIGSTVQDYIDIAVKLGNDPAQRTALRAKLQAALPALHADPGVGERLNTFYADAYESWIKTGR